MAASMSASWVPTFLTYPLTSKITDAFSASARPVSRKQVSASSNHATS
jgi:hypothetical protein